MTQPFNPRRRFLMSMAATGAVAISPHALAQSKVDEKDTQAVALGYVNNATTADAKKFPKYAAGQMCGTCALYQGKAGDATGNCPLFAGKVVSVKGWCSAWAMKG